MKSGKPAQDDNTQNQGDVDIDEYEGPERQHIVEPRATYLLARHTHDDRQDDGIDHRRDSSLISADETEGVDPLTQQEQHGYQQQETCQDDAIRRPRERIPHDRAHAQFESQSCHNQPPAYQEAFFHCPRFIPHQIFTFFPFYFLKMSKSFL